MSDAYDALPSEEQLLYQGVALCAVMAEAVRRDIGREYAEGSMIWAVHKSHANFEEETTNFSGGIGKFTEDGEWFLGAFPSSAVEKAGVDFESDDPTAVCVCVMIGDDENTIMLPLADMIKTAQELDKKLGFRVRLSSSKINSRGGDA